MQISRYFLFPCFPDVRAVAHSGLLTVSDDRRLYEVWHLIELIKLCLRRREVLEKRIILIGGVGHCVQPYSIFDGIQLSPAHAIFQDIYELILYPAFLEITLGLFRIKALALAEYLNIHRGLYLGDDRQNHGAAAGGLIKIPGYIALDLALDASPIGYMLVLAGLD